MGLWQGIFLVLGCALAGLIVGLGIMYALQRKKAKQYSIFQKEKNYAKAGTPATSAVAASNDVKASSNVDEDPLEALVKSRKNNVVIESPKQSVPELPVVPEFTGQQSAPIVENEETPVETKAINWTELILPHNEPLTPKEPVTVNQKNTMVADEPKKSADISPRKTIIVGEAPKKTTKTVAAKKQEAVSVRVTPVVKQPKKPVKPVVPEPEFIKDEIMPVVEEHIEPPQHSVLEPEVFMSESIAAAEKHTESPQSNVWEPESVKQESIPAVEKHIDAGKSDFMQELENNLAVATMPWSDKLTSFQTKCWDTKHGEYEPLLTAHHQELIQLYVDIGLANNIVWLATEIGHRSKELDDSYIKLCKGIAESIKHIAPSLDNIG